MFPVYSWFLVLSLNWLNNNWQWLMAWIVFLPPNYLLRTSYQPNTNYLKTGFVVLSSPSIMIAWGKPDVRNRPFFFYPVILLQSLSLSIFFATTTKFLPNKLLSLLTSGSSLFPVSALSQPATSSGAMKLLQKLTFKKGYEFSNKFNMYFSNPLID